MKKVLLGAKYSIIEPLSLLYLTGIAHEEGWQSKIALVENHDYTAFNKIVNEFKPNLIGFTLYTGNHLQTFDYLSQLKKNKKDIKIVLGGPHPTYFPKESINYADYVVLSEGFHSFRQILRNEVNPGIIPLTSQEPFPVPNRAEFYKDYPNHRNSPIKSVITHSGCPFSCTYCYNSSTLEDIADALDSEQIAEMGKVVGKSRRLFPQTSRSVEDIVSEVKNIIEISPQTKLIFFQDDLFGSDINWVREFTKKYSSLNIPFHAQMRFEYANPKNPICRERLELMQEAGCTGLTMAIESADPIIRQEVLNRNMKEELMFETFSFLSKLGYKVRTEQMLGLPCGATSQPTKINLDADLDVLELNVRLKEETGLPTMAWASTFVPYKGTKIFDYCLKYGFYSGETGNIPDTFFERSILNFPKKWVGPNLSPNNKEMWLSKQEQEEYRDKLQFLRNLFNYFALIPKGHKLAKKFLEQEEHSFFELSTCTRRHLYDSVLYEVE